MMQSYSGTLTRLPENGIFVFGSNTQGRHGKGAALTALKFFGAIYGMAMGFQGRSYAIITKDLTKKVHPSVTKDFIRAQILDLYLFAIVRPTKDFYVAYSGSGSNLNAYTNEEMADMFRSSNIPKNIIFEESFNNLVRKSCTIKSN